MVPSFEIYLIAGSLLLVASIFANNVISRFGVPSLLIFLLIGMLAGSEGLGGLYFDDYQAAQSLGVVALVYILFFGGLETEWKDIRPVLKPGLSLATLGVALTCFAMGVFTSFLLDFSLIEGMLLGATVASTDAVAVFSVMRHQKLNLKGDIKPLLELESGSNDPMAVLLTVGLLQILQGQDLSGFDLIPFFLKQMTIGAILGWLGGKGIEFLLRRLKLDSEGLYPVFSMALVLLLFAGTQSLKGNGFLAVYLAGIFLSRKNFLAKRSIMQFHDGLAWLMQITMFLALGLLVYPSHLLPVSGTGLLLAAFLIFVARPISVFLALLPFKFSMRETLLVSWVGLRGAVPIILATYPLLAGIEKAEEIFNLVFFIVLASVLIQGTPIPMVARLLKLDLPYKPKFRYPIEYRPSEDLKESLEEIEVTRGSFAEGRAVIDLGLPEGVLIVLIQRNHKVLVPKGGTVIEAGDHLLVLSDETSIFDLHRILKQRA